MKLQNEDYNGGLVLSFLNLVHVRVRYKLHVLDALRVSLGHKAIPCLRASPVEILEDGEWGARRRPYNK